MKKTTVLLGLVMWALPAATGHAAIEAAAPQNNGQQFGALPLMEWDEPELLAQQEPVATPVEKPVVTPPAPTPPPQAQPATPATPQTVPAPQPVTPAAPAAPDAKPPETVPTPGDSVDQPDPNAPDAEGEVREDTSLGDVPIVEIVELTPDIAKKALDAYILVRDKYKDADLESYESFQDFVDQAPQGKPFETDVKAAGFANVTEWNTAVTSLSFAYDNSINDQTAETKQQISDLEKETDIAKDMRDRMIKALQAMIPSDNNKKVVEQLKADPAYAEKLKILETETE